MILRGTYPVLTSTQSRAWVNQDLMIRWIDHMFPLVDMRPGKCLIWDSCKAHIAKRVKAHCYSRNIKLIVIPGGCTPYLQAGDIAVFRELKAKLGDIINAWKESGEVHYTAGGNPKKPANHVVESWVNDAWRSLSLTTIKNSIESAGLSDNYEDWYISKHDIYGDKFREAWKNSGNGTETEVSPETLEAIGQDDDIEFVDECIDE